MLEQRRKMFCVFVTFCERGLLYALPSSRPGSRAQATLYWTSGPRRCLCCNQSQMTNLPSPIKTMRKKKSHFSNYPVTRMKLGPMSHRESSNVASTCVFTKPSELLSVASFLSEVSPVANLKFRRRQFVLVHFTRHPDPLPTFRNCSRIDLAQERHNHAHC